MASKRLPDDIERQEKKTRLATVNELQERIQTELNRDLEGKKFDVLVDGRTRGRLQGRTRGDKIVYLDGSDSLIGSTKTVEITESSPWSLRGEFIEASKMVASVA